MRKIRWNSLCVLKCNIKNMPQDVCRISVGNLIVTFWSHRKYCVYNSVCGFLYEVALVKYQYMNFNIELIFCIHFWVCIDVCQLQNFLKFYFVSFSQLLQVHSIMCASLSPITSNVNSCLSAELYLWLARELVNVILNHFQDQFCSGWISGVYWHRSKKFLW